MTEFKPTDEQRYSVELMAGIGIPQDDIASALGVAAKTLRRHFGVELKIGRTKTITKVADSLVRQALAGNMTAAIFYLKTQGGWRERPADGPQDRPASKVGKKEAAQADAEAVSSGASDWGDDLGSALPN